MQTRHNHSSSGQRGSGPGVSAAGTGRRSAAHRDRPPVRRRCRHTPGSAPRSPRERRLAGREGLGVPGPALHAAQPGQSEEDLVVEPVVRDLRRVALCSSATFSRICSSVSGDVQRGPAEVAVPLGDLVVQHQVVAEDRRWPARRAAGGPGARRAGSGASTRSACGAPGRCLEELLGLVPVRGQPAVRQLGRRDGDLAPGQERSAPRRASSSRSGVPVASTNSAVSSGTDSASVSSVPPQPISMSSGARRGRRCGPARRSGRAERQHQIATTTGSPPWSTSAAARFSCDPQRPRRVARVVQLLELRCAP